MTHAPVPESNTMITVRKGTLDDAADIAAFNLAMAHETEDKALDPATIRAGVESLFERPELGFYLVAESSDSDAGIVGCLMITYEWSDWRNGVFWWIQSVYVRSEHRGSGVFSTLYREVESLAADSGDAAGIRLYVEHDNQRAQRTYQSLGMVETRYKLYETCFTHT